MENKESEKTNSSESIIENKSNANTRALMFFVAGAVLGAFTVLAFSPRGGDGSATIICNPPDKIVTLEKAQTLYDTYTDRRGTLISDFETDSTASTTFNPTRYGDYEFDMFQSYMDFLNCLDLKLKENADSIKSIRFYFGNYPDSTHFRNRTLVDVSLAGESYRGRNTFMIVPTSELYGKDQGFLYKLNSTGIVIDTFNTPATGFKSLILNEAGLRPPPPEGDDDFSL